MCQALTLVVLFLNFVLWNLFNVGDIYFQLQFFKALFFIIFLLLGKKQN